MSYFFLRSDVLLIIGAFKGALYDLKNGSIYSVPKPLKLILTETEKGINIDSIPNTAIITTALKNLENEHLGYFSNKYEPPIKIKISPPKPKLNMMWLALNYNCNLLCKHCYSTSKPGLNDGSLDFAYLFEAMREAKENFDLECIQLIGGEPLLLGKKKVFDIVNKAYELKIPVIEIFTNGHLIDEKYIEFFKEKDVNIAISIYSNSSQDHDAVTNKKGSWKKTIKAIRMVQRAGLKLRFGIVAMTENEKSVAETTTWLEKEFGISQMKKFDVVRTCGRGNNKNIIPWDLFKSQYVRIKEDFLPVSISTLETTMFTNICWGKEICIMPNGDVTPCEMEFSNVEGNITSQSLTDILLSENSNYSQRLTKDKIKICQDCEYRYACWECRAMTHQLDTQKNSKPLTCMYNPYNGEWESPPDNLEELFPALKN